MNPKFWLPLSAAALLALAGCQQASSPATVQNDVAKAQEKAASKDAKAQQEEAKTDASANGDVAKAEDKAEDKKAGSAYDTAVTEAEGQHKVDVAKCEGLSGDAKSACKDKADARLETAKANAKAEKTDR
jgi:hypothetical protein